MRTVDRRPGQEKVWRQSVEKAAMRAVERRSGQETV